MRFIEVTSRNKRKEMMSYDELNGWLRKNANPRYARHIVTCYYRNRKAGNMHYEFIDVDKTTVPERCHGMGLERIRL